MSVSFLPCGDTAFTVEFGDRVDRMLSRRVLSLHARLREHPLPGLLETVPTFRSLLVHYDPLQTNQKILCELILPIATNDMTSEPIPELSRLPACYDKEVAFDLEDVASELEIDPEHVIRLHSDTLHYVYMIGFAPGHPYLGDLPQSLTLPRRKDPRVKVPAGTIAIAVGMTVVYPFNNPCGWHVIAQTPLRLFDQRRSRPNLLAAGDTVDSTGFSLAEFRRLSVSSEVGSEGLVAS